MPHKTKRAIPHTGGFSLVEIMVALVIGMLACIVMLQVFALSEERKRTSTGASDAQSNGVMMFYQLQRDIGQAGFGFNSATVFNCNTTWKVASGSDIATPIPLAPVTINPPATIVPAGDANTDTLLVMYGNGNGQPQGVEIKFGTSEYTVTLPLEFKQNDRVIAAAGGCGAASLFIDQVTQDITQVSDKVKVATGFAGDMLYNLGQSPTVLAYRIHKGNLTVCDYLVNDCSLDAKKDDASIWTPIAPNVVSLRAQYGRDTTGTMDNIPDVYHQITPGSASDTSGIAAGCGWARIPAVRLALVTRSGQYDKEEVTASAPTWAASAADNPAGSTAAAINLSGNTDWKHYRYKTFEGLMPIRNVTWLGVPQGC
ncbi:PilW family protein [Janthinobacterium sp. 17J80-10]|uniref:PilW family protein n=1 Tax=Janthinobacterium sp. 17J80-10 TaxID=2497863 RepID=UPI0013E8EFA2|nr:PilW family protein [Janthinobacterium sp. 17J80-10]